MRETGRHEFNQAEQELKKLAELKAQAPSTEHVPAEIQTVEADLGNFAVVSDGSGNLSVSHPSLQDSTVGIISENEYKKADKEAILKSMLMDRFASFASTHALTFTGSFVEPTITKAEKIVEHPVEKKASQEPEFIPSKETTSDDLLRAASHDSFRETIEREAFRNQETINRFVTSSTNALVQHLSGLRYGSPKILSANSEKLIQSEQGLNGFITVEATLDDASGPKALNIPVTVTSSNFILPNDKEMKDLVSKAVDLRSELYSKLVEEATSKMANVDAEVAYHEAEADAIINEKTAELEKTASDYTDGVAYNGPGAVIKLQKHLLPVADLNVGETIYADGKHYKLIDKGEHVDQNDKNAESASLWSFVECLPSDEEKPKGFVQR